jgi:hypothetical protein
MSKKVFFKSLREGRAKLTEIGVDPGFMSLKDMATTYEQELKRKGIGIAIKTPALAKVAPKVAVPTVADIKAAIAKEANVGARLDMLGSLRATLEGQLKEARSDMVRQSELARELNRVQKAEAYESLALRTENPAAAKARRIRDLSNLD